MLTQMSYSSPLWRIFGFIFLGSTKLKVLLWLQKVKTGKLAGIIDLQDTLIMEN